MSGPTDPDEGFERLLRGALPEDPEQQLGAFVEDVRAAFPATPLLAEESHLAAISSAARLLAREGVPAIGGNEGPRRARIPERRRFDVRLPMFRSLAAKIVAGLAALMWSLGALAVAGALPGGLQDVVSNSADQVSVSLSGDDGAEDDEAEDDDAEDEADDEAEDDADDQGDDDQGDDEGDDNQGDDEGDDDQGDDADEDDDDSDEDDDDSDEDEDDSGEDSDDSGEDD